MREKKISSDLFANDNDNDMRRKNSKLGMMTLEN